MATRSQQLTPVIGHLAIIAVFFGTNPFVFSTESPVPHRDKYGDPLPPHAIARLGTVRFRGVRGSLTFSPDGKRLASETTEGGVALWETATGRAVRRFTAPGRYLSFSADGKRLACSDNLRCHIIDVANGKELFAVKGSHGIFSGDGKTLVTGTAFSGPWEVRIWDARTGRQLRKWPAGEWIEELTLAADGRMAAWTNRGKPVVQIRDLETGAIKHSISIAKGRHWLALSPDSKTLAIANGKHVCLWDIATGKRVRCWEQRSDSRPVFSRDGQRLAWTGYDGEMGIARIWMVQREEDAPHAVGEPVNSFEPPCLSPDGKSIAVLTDAHALQLRRISDGKEAPPLDAHDSPLIRMVLTVDGRHVVNWCRTGVFTWETLTGRLVRRAPDAEWKNADLTRLLAGGRLLTTDKQRGLVMVRDMEMGRELWRSAALLDTGPSPIAIAPGERYIAVQGHSGEVSIWDVRTGKCSYRLDFKEAGHGLRLSSDGDVLVRQRIAATGLEVEVHRHAAKKALVLRDLPKDRRLGWCLDSWHFSFLSSDGRWLVLSTQDGRLHRWDLVSGKEVSPLAESLRSTWELVWSPDGRFVAAKGSAWPPNVLNNVIGEKELRDVRVWDVRTGTRLAHLTVPNPHVEMHVLFADDGHTMLTTDSQGVIRLWEIATGQERGRLRGHLPDKIGSLALSVDGRTLVSGGNDSQGFVWDLTGRMPDGQWHLTQHSPKQRRAYWEALASPNAKAAYLAMWQLAADPEGTIAFLREQLRPIAQPQPGQIAGLIAALDSAAFAERERANEELEKLGEIVSAELRLTLSQKPSLEARRRIEASLEKLQGVPQGRRLRALRAVEVLERIGTPQARNILRKLAEGAAAARLTQEAQRALQRRRLTD